MIYWKSNVPMWVIDISGEPKPLHKRGLTRIVLPYNYVPAWMKGHKARVVESLIVLDSYGINFHRRLKPILDAPRPCASRVGGEVQLSANTATSATQERRTI